MGVCPTILLASVPVQVIIAADREGAITRQFWQADEELSWIGERKCSLQVVLNNQQGAAMNDKNIRGVHWSFWLISALALIWNVLGAINYVVQMDPDAITAYRESERAIIEGRPAWATAGFALAVFGGALGCLLLLLRKSVAFYLFIASLLGVIVATVHTLGVGIDFGPGEIVGIILMPLAVAAFLIWYAKLAESRGWVK